jgi:hypothetical protein
MVETDGVGFGSVPVSYIPYTLGGVLTRVVITYDNNGAAITYGISQTNEVAGTEASISAISSITLYRSDFTLDVCGIQFNSDGIIGCGSNGVTIDFPNDNFAFFAQVWSSTAFYLIPYSYTLYHPHVIAYQPIDTSITFKLAFPSAFATVGTTTFTMNWQYRDEFWSSGHILGLHDDVETFNYETDLEYQSWSEDIPCFPVSLSAEVDQLAPSGGARDRYFSSAFAPFWAWTIGYDNSDFLFVPAPLDPSPGTTTTYTGYPWYYDSLDVNTETCREMFPVQIGYVDGTLYVRYEEDELALGTVSGNAIDWSGDISGRRFTTAIGYFNRIDTNDVNGDAQTHVNAFVGLSMTDSIGTVTVGSTTANYAVTYSLNGQYIAYFVVTYTENDALYNFQVHFAEPHAPQLIEPSVVADPLFGFGWGSSLFSPAFDGDLLHYHWYNPVDYSSMHAQITGFFLKDFDEVFWTTATPVMDRGSAGGSGANFYHLIADQMYDVDLWGTEAVAGQLSQRSGTSYMTPNAVQFRCEQGGAMVEQIEFEAIPEPFICIYEDGSGLVKDEDNTGTLTVADSDGSQNQYPNSEFFFYDANDEHYPKYPDFFGYPTDVYVYWSDATDGGGALTDSCLRGIGIRFKSRDDTYFSTVWLAGSQAGYDGTTGKTSGDIEGMLVDTVRAAGSNCYTGIEFVDTRGSVDDATGCLGPAASCDDLVSNAPSVSGDPSYYLYSLSVGYDANNNNRVHFVQPRYAAVDLPSLRQIDSSCLLAEFFDYHYVRNSYWTFENDLSTDNTVCGTIKNIYSDDTVQTFEHEVSYEQNVVRVRDQQSSLVLSGTGTQITRFNTFRVDSYCYYDAQGVVSSSFATRAEDPLVRSGVNQLNYQIVIYSDSTYNTAYSAGSNPTLFIGENVYIMVRLLEDIDNVVVTAYDCWATEDNNPNNNNRWTLEANSCPVDSTFVRTNPAEETFRDDAASFEAFAWAENGVANAVTVWLHCNVRACPSDNDGECIVPDPSTCGDKKRQRRDVSSQMVASEQTITRSDPLIFVSRRHAETMMIERDPVALEGAKRTFAGGFAFMATGLVLCALFVARKVYKTRRDYFRMQAANC